MNPTTKRFWQKVDKSGECWLWTASKRFKGYGAFVWHDGRDIVQGRAHRYSWIIHNGMIPQGMCVLHRCDNPACVRPDHLFLGTKSDNNRDMKMKGRHRPGGSKTPVNKCRYERGESHHNARLSWPIIRAIRHDHDRGMSYSKLGNKYKITPSHAYRIAEGLLWKPMKGA